LSRVAAASLLSEYTLGAAAIARAFTSYTGALINGNADLLRVPLGSEYFMLDIPALLIVMALCALLAFGTKAGAHFNSAVTIGNLLVIAFVLATGLPHFDVKNFSPFLPMGLRGTFSGASKVPLISIIAEFF
jgi:basic amino acid/polyamine antiporter, APA family